MAADRVKPGTSRVAASARRQAFIDAYLTNGRNGTQAAISAGYSARSARTTASILLADPNISAQVAQKVASAEEIAGLTLERTLKEIASLSFSDARKLYNPDGSMKKPHEWDDATAAAVASMSTDASLTTQTRFWDKGQALDKAMKFFGAYERDNSQQRAENNLNLQIVLKE